MTNSDNQEKKSFTVKDNRRFDEQGAERGGAQATASHSTTTMSSTSPSASEQGSTEINFSSFLMSFATQALMQLGIVPPPDGIQLATDIGAAKQTIDILAMLEEKTKGNLNAEEVQLMKEALYSLRLSYVKATKK